MKRCGKKSVFIMILLTLLFSSIFSIDIYAATKYPATVKNLKKVKVSTVYSKKYKKNVSSVKIKFNKIKGSDGYQVLVYQTKRLPAGKTPYAIGNDTKSAVYTLKNLVPDVKYTIKVRAYKKDRDGNTVYGKFKSIKIKTSGRKKGTYYKCLDCGVFMVTKYYYGKYGHLNFLYNQHKELHARVNTYHWK